jgi:hypothetical protein
MRQDWHPEELERYWTLSGEERGLLGNRTGATRLGFAILLKSFQFDGRFPECREDVSAGIVTHLSHQTGALAETFWEGEWSERTQRHQRAQIRGHFGFQIFHAEDEAAFLAWLMERVASPNPDAEAFKIAAYGYLRNQRMEPPPTERLRRLLRQAVAAREERMIAETAAQLSQATRHALDTLVATHLPAQADDADQIPLFPVRSELSGVKDDAGSVKVETVLEEIAKLRQLRALELPETLFLAAPPQLVRQYRQRAASEPPRELRRHPPEIRYTLLAALCWQREREITDNLVELLIRIAHRVAVRAEEKVGEELLRFAKKVVGKARLLYKLAKAAKEQPDGTVKDVIYPAVGEETLEELIREVEMVHRHDRQVKFVTRASYSHHYRRIVPALLKALSFQSNNDRHRPVTRIFDRSSAARSTGRSSNSSTTNSSSSRPPCAWGQRTPSRSCGASQRTTCSTPPTRRYASWARL